MTIKTVIMAERHDIRVEISINGLSQPIYPNPDSEDESFPSQEIYYTEAIPDAKFRVKVTLAKNFSMKGAEGVKVDLCLDGGEKWHYFLSKSKHGAELSASFAYFPLYDPKTREWKKAEFSFGRLLVGKCGNTIYNEDTADGMGHQGKQMVIKRCPLI